MVRLIRKSFRLRIFLALFAAALIPTLAATQIVTQVFRIRMEAHFSGEASQYLTQLDDALTQVFEEIGETAEVLGEDPAILGALDGWETLTTEVNRSLFSATEGKRSLAVFEIYDRNGGWRYSTERTRVTETLPTDWGILGAAAKAESEGLIWRAAPSVTDETEPLYLGSEAIRNESGDLVGFLVVRMSQENFQGITEGKYGSVNDLIVLNEYYRPVYSAQPLLAATLAPQIRAQLLAGKSLDLLSDSFVFQIRECEAGKLFLVLRRPLLFTETTFRQLLGIGLAATLVSLAIAFVLSLSLSSRLFRPIERLHDAMQEVSLDHLTGQLKPESEDELGELTGRFNRMLEELRDNREELIQNEKERNEAQIRMLQAQLNPHFLMNTLDTMKWISKINQVPQVADMSTDLADILRFGISPNEFVTLRQELGILTRYIEIQNIRTSGQITYEERVPEELKNCRVPKMILQPMVENAILHGIADQEHGCITVDAVVEDEVLLIFVEDDGVGIPEGMKGPYHRPETTGRRHMGLYNVDTILKKNYGEEYGLFLDGAASGTGTRVTARLPYETASIEEENGYA